MRKKFFVAAVMLPLAACTTVDDPFLETGALTANGPALATSVSADYAIATLPGLDARSVRQTVGENQAEQTILFANATDLAGENALTVTVSKTGRSVTGAPSQGEIEAEMRSAFSGIRMRVCTLIAGNAYGVFGYATGPLGKSGGCVYAWQRIRSMTPTGGTGLTRSGYAAQIRLRYCNPSMEQDRIALLMQGLRIRPVSSETFRTLRIAAASGQAAAAPVSVAQPVLEPFVAPVLMHATPEIAAAAPVHRTPRRVAVEETSSEPAKPDEKTIGNAVKVPMPGEAAVLIASDTTPAAEEQVMTGKTLLKPSPVPLPDTVALTAQ